MYVHDIALRVTTYNNDDNDIDRAFIRKQIIIIIIIISPMNENYCVDNIRRICLVAKIIIIIIKSSRAHI